MVATQPDDVERLFEPMTHPTETFGDDALAAEYVLHLLSADDRRAFEARLLEDQALRVRVINWEIKFAGMAEEVDPVQPPARLKALVMGAVGDTGKRSADKRWSLWNWAMGALAATGVVAILLLTIMFPLEQTSIPTLRTQLSSEDGAIVLAASFNAPTHEIVVEPVAGTPLEGRVFELWLIADSIQSPVSLGVLSDDEATRISVPIEMSPSVPAGTIAISDEPVGGSQTGQPTGTVLATATFSEDST